MVVKIKKEDGSMDVYQEAISVDTSKNGTVSIVYVDNPDCIHIEGMDGVHVFNHYAKSVWKSVEVEA